jgi:phosphatidylglycerophosphatase A
MVDKRIGGGFGIMFDDVLAACYAWLALQGLAWLVWMQ